MVNDTVGDMITRLRNANFVKIKDVRVQKTKVTVKIAQILKEEGFIESVQECENSSFITIRLKYKEKKAKPCIVRLKRISKPGLRVYVNKNEMKSLYFLLNIKVFS